MLHFNESVSATEVKQVENNTIAVAMPCISPFARDVHAFVLDHLNHGDLVSNMPPNLASYGVCNGLHKAWTLYKNKSASILFVVEGHDMSNICDQRNLEFGLWTINNNIKVLRRTFPELRTSAVLKDKKLFVGDKEIALVYYRWGYMPEHYEEADWETRLMIERSAAIKCPSVAYHLAGTKRVQQELSCPGVLERFLPKHADATKIRKVFAKQYLLDPNVKDSEAMFLAMDNPDQYVLKPDREGGGNNIFGENIVALLETPQNVDNRQIYILMDKINAPPCPTYVVKHNELPRRTKVVMEVGIYGVSIATDVTGLCHNREVGYVVKSKEFGMDEGGLCSGLSYIDTPLLY